MEILVLAILAIVAIVILAAVALKRTPEEIGRDGEISTAHLLRKISNQGKNGKILTNLYIPTGDDRSVEIDLLFITQKGLFVIENKNYAGYIFGSEKNKNWAETLYGGKYKGVEKYHFYNPIWQNRSHIKWLKWYLNKDVKCISVIVFSNRCELKSISVDSEDTYVCYQSELNEVISSCWASLPDTIGEGFAEKIYQKLMPLTDIDEEKKRKHIQHVNTTKQYQSAKSAVISKKPEKCPWCDGTLVVRTAKHGPNAGSQFYGCSNFPNCRYTRNIQ